MLHPFKRFFLFSVAGTFVMTLWGSFFGAISGILVHFLSREIAPASGISMGLHLIWATQTLCLPLIPLSLVLFGSAALLAPQRGWINLPSLVRLCVSRSALATLTISTVGAVFTGIEGLTTTHYDDQFAPTFVYGMVGGWILGFFVGILWGFIEGIRPSKKRPTAACPIASVPPIAAP